VASRAGRDFKATSYSRLVAGIISLLALVGIVAGGVVQFRGGFTRTAPITVMSDRAGLLMNPGARVKLHGAQVGTVADVRQTPDGRAELTLAIDPARLAIIPANTLVEIGATTVFGAKAVEFLTPPEPSTTPLSAGQILDSQHVTVEANTIFEQLNQLLGKIDPAKLNATLTAISTAFGDRGQSFGQSLSDFNAFLAKFEPSLPQLTAALQMLPEVSTAYADAAPDFMTLVRNAVQISKTLVDKQSSLDRFLVSTIGLADIGNDVLGSNRERLADVVHLLAPTTDLTSEYHEALNCSLVGMLNFALKPPGPVPGINDLGALTMGIERYRYPQDLPKVAATGPPQCAGQLPLQFGTWPNKVVADVGTNPARYGNPNLMWNTDLWKQILFGPVDGPPRNSSQFGQPG
jgi:virulence factor Mce-like protein